MTYGPPNVSPNARKLWAAAVEECSPRFSAYPAWIPLYEQIGLSREQGLAAFEELCGAKVVADGFPSTIDALEAIWPLGRQGRPLAHVWKAIRNRIFERDDYTCRYCGERGRKLECDHIIPVARGGSYDEDNLATACRPCNRSKRDKTLAEWRGAAQ